LPIRHWSIPRPKSNAVGRGHSGVANCRRAPHRFIEEEVMSTLHPVPAAFAANARYDRARYDRDYTESVRDPAGFWGEIGKRLDWIKPYTEVKDTSFDADDLHIRWYADGELNVAANCLDRHLATRGDKTAIIWEGDSPDESRRISYRELH